MKYEEPKFETVLLLQTYGVMTVTVASIDGEASGNDVEEVDGNFNGEGF